MSLMTMIMNSYKKLMSLGSIGHQKRCVLLPSSNLALAATSMFCFLSNMLSLPQIRVKVSCGCRGVILVGTPLIGVKLPILSLKL